MLPGRRGNLVKSLELAVAVVEHGLQEMCLFYNFANFSFPCLSRWEEVCKYVRRSALLVWRCIHDSRGIPGLLTKTLARVDKTEVCVDTCRKYANHLGYDIVFTKVSKGTFTDKHESEENATDRNDRFLTQRLEYSLM